MKKIVMLPLERLEQRYTVEWYDWFNFYMKPYAVIDGVMVTDKIEDGAFLDICGTNYFKATQIAKTVKFIKDHKDDPDKMKDYIFFTTDVWHCGIESLAYIRDGLGLKFKIAGCLHAGTYDKFDFITHKGMGYWGKDYENSLFRIFDYVFVATEWHKRQLIHSRDVEPNKVHVTGFPIYYEQPYPMPSPLNVNKENIIVFPNRLTIDKNPQLFEFVRDNTAFCPRLKEWQFVTTFSDKGFLSKKDYWSMLFKSKIMISFADHENWGISVQEALFAGCFVILPNKLSYVELYNPIIRYNSAMDLFPILDLVLDACEDATDSLHKLRERDRDYALKRGGEAIPNMLKIMEAV